MEKELIYFAGIIDGEGSIGITKCKKFLKEAKRGYRYQAFFSIANTNVPMLKYLQSYFGGYIVRQSRRDGSAYQLQFNANDIRFLLPKLLPYLLIKKARALVVIEFLGLQQKNSCRRISDDLDKVYTYLFEKCKSISSKVSFITNDIY